MGKSFCVNCGEMGTIRLVPPPRPLLSWCTKCWTPKREADQGLLFERNLTLLAPPGISADERAILIARANGLRISYIAQRLGMPCQQAAQIEARLLATLN